MKNSLPNDSITKEVTDYVIHLIACSLDETQFQLTYVFAALIAPL
jgi:hypothetical protein